MARRHVPAHHPLKRFGAGATPPFHREGDRLSIRQHKPRPPQSSPGSSPQSSFFVPFVLVSDASAIVSPSPDRDAPAIAGLPTRYPPPARAFSPSSADQRRSVFSSRLAGGVSPLERDAATFVIPCPSLRALLFTPSAKPLATDSELMYNTPGSHHSVRIQ